MANLTKQQQQVVVAVSLFVLCGGYVYWNYMLKPTMENIRTREATLQDLDSKIETAERQARRLPALRSEKEKLELELSSLEKQLPKDKDMPNILRILTREALQEDLQFTRLAPRPTNKQQFFEIIPFEVQFTGTLHAFARFLASLGQQDRIFQAQSITLSPGGSQADNQGFTGLNISLTIQTYAYTG
jgi:type IV pilus assembly protein PilO